ncbi:hypothetical protein ACEPAI_4878 [Sanghuangporus weigelae]
MVALSGLFVPLLLLLCALPLGATPVPQASPAGTRRQHAIAELLSFLCSIKPLNFLLCGNNFQGLGRGTVTISTPVGDATGSADSSAAARFAVRYATTTRWQESVMATKWELPNGATDPSALPLACPQTSNDLVTTGQSEDCLSMILYVPAAAAVSKVPAMMWIHGGSFVIGSATNPGLDGAALAEATGSIIAVVQYRLGALGFLSPGGQSNLAVKDTINALQFLQRVLPSFNGDTRKVTIAGQSSGATMVRALLATPSASGLFRSASIHSDPMNYGFLSPGTFQTLNDFLKSQLSCDASDSACLNNISTDDIVGISTNVFNTASSLDASAGAAMPLRPVTDGSLVTSPLDITVNFPRQSKTIIVSTVEHEAGPTIYSMFTDPLPEAAFASVCNITLGADRTSKVVNSQHYALPASDSTSDVDARVQLETAGTDQIWRCPSWTFARAFAAAGGKVYVGKYVVGVTYPDNEDIAFCKDGGICHEDDIQVVFGTASSPTREQKNLATQIQARMKSFLASGTPNARGYQSWSTVQRSNVNALVLGGSGGGADVGACDPSFWGQEVPYDYQLFGN